MCDIGVYLGQCLRQPDQPLHLIEQCLYLRDLSHKLLPLAMLVEKLLGAAFDGTGLLLLIKIIAHVDLRYREVENLAKSGLVFLGKSCDSFIRVVSDWVLVRVRINRLQLEKCVFPALLSGLGTEEILPRQEELLFESLHLSIVTWICKLDRTQRVLQCLLAEQISQLVDSHLSVLRHL